VLHWLEFTERLINMSKIFKRPMFRKGGPTSGMNGIMTGIVDRENHAENPFVGGQKGMGVNTDFNLEERLVSKGVDNQFIFTGLHITKRSFLKSEKSKVFSMNKIWSDLIKNKNLYGLESKQKFYHLNTFEMYNKISSLKIID